MDVNVGGISVRQDILCVDSYARDRGPTPSRRVNRFRIISIMLNVGSVALAWGRSGTIDADLADLATPTPRRSARRLLAYNTPDHITHTQAL